MGKDCRCPLVEQIAPLLETLPLARATCSVVRLRSYGDDARWAMADPGPGPNHRRREPGWRLEGGGEIGLLAHARSGGVLLAAGRFSVLDGPRHPRHHRKRLNARRHLGDPLQPRPGAGSADVDPASTLGHLRREVQRPDARSVYACPGALWRPERSAPGQPLGDEGDSGLLRRGTREEARAGSGAATHAR